MGHKTASKFSSRIIAGSLLAILLGDFLDNQLGTKPIILLILLAYVIIGSFYLLIKEAK